MAAGDIVPVPGAQFEETLASASPDVLRGMVREFAQRMMDGDVEVRCNDPCVSHDFRKQCQHALWRQDPL
jgi:hypothetical protein